MIGVRQLHVPREFLARAWQTECISPGIAGHASARNWLLDHSEGDILMVDEDTVPWCEDFYEVMESAAGDVVCARARVQGPKVRLGAMVLVREHVRYLRFRGFGPSEVLEDADFFRRVRAAGMEVGLTGPIVCSTAPETQQKASGEAMMEFKRADV